MTDRQNWTEEDWLAAEENESGTAQMPERSSWLWVAAYTAILGAVFYGISNIEKIFNLRQVPF